jgi:hypothetical protein
VGCLWTQYKDDSPPSRAPDIFRNEATDTRMGSGSANRIEDERVAMAYRLLFACAFANSTVIRFRQTQDLERMS